jgi:hypothetical protein
MGMGIEDTVEFMLVCLFERALAGKLDSRANINLKFIAQSTIYKHILSYDACD